MLTRLGKSVQQPVPTAPAPPTERGTSIGPREVPRLNRIPGEGVSATESDQTSPSGPTGVWPRYWSWPFIVAIVVVLGCAALALSQYRAFAKATASVAQAYGVLNAVDELERRLLSAESGLRGYLVSRDRAFLHSYEEVGNDASAVLARLQTLVDGDPSRTAAWHVLDQRVRAKLDEMARIAAMYERGDPQGAAARLTPGHAAMDRVTATANDMRRAENARLAEGSVQARAARRAASGLGLLSVLAAIVLGVQGVLVRRQFELRQSAYASELRAKLSAQRDLLAAAADLQHSESFNRSILDSSADCIQVLDTEGRMLLTNRTGIQLMELDDAESVRGQEWPLLWGADAVVARKTLQDAIATGEGRFSAYRLSANGVPRWWDVMVTPVKDNAGHVFQYVTISRDISGHKQREEERTQLLASERAARSEAERAARMRDEFVSTLSHELRTPLNAILGWVGVLRQDRSPETLLKALDVIDRNSHRQSQMIDDLLDVSRIITGKLRLDVERVDVASAIEEALASAQPAADVKGVRLLRLLGPATVMGDSGRLQQVVWNLLSNAVKFTPAGGTVQVSSREVDRYVEVHVKDNGRGIDAEMLPHIFERFRQADAPVPKQQRGLGLGLAIVKSLVELHGGSIEAFSDGEGRGATFTIRLPAAPAGHANTSTTPLLATADEMLSAMLLSGVTALVVDDDADSLELLRRLLENAGAQVTTAANVEEALAHIARGVHPDVIVSDIGMPDQDGYEFMRRVRAMPGTIATIPAAALTALARLEDRKRALMSGYHTHLAKPVDPVELVATVASLTGRTGRSV